MYWSSIIWFLTWPALVVLSYRLVKYVVLKYNDEFENVEDIVSDQKL